MAQAEGLAEADPTLDVNGMDAAHKLAIIAREALGRELNVDDIDCQGITDLEGDRLKRALSEGRVPRLVACCRFENGRIRASVGPKWLAADHPLARVSNEGNAISITGVDGSVVTVAGKGAKC